MTQQQTGNYSRSNTNGSRPGGYARDSATEVRSRQNRNQRQDDTLDSDTQSIFMVNEDALRQLICTLVQQEVGDMFRRFTSNSSQFDDQTTRYSRSRVDYDDDSEANVQSRSRGTDNDKRQKSRDDGNN